MTFLPGPGIRVEPNPAIAGGRIEVEFHGEGKLYMWDFADPAGGWKEVPLDGNGRATVRVPPGSIGLGFSNRRKPQPEERFVEVFSTGD